MTAIDTGDPDACTAFVLRETRPLAPPLVAEMTLRIADASIPLWQRTEEDLGALGLPPPFWAFAWAGGQALARYLLDNPAVVAGRRVIDLGTGSGLIAIAAARAGATRVLAADIDRLALAAVAINARANGVAERIVTTIVDLLAAPPEPCDVVLIGDLFYERPLADRVLAYATTAATAGAAVFAGDPKRSYFPVARFVEVARSGVPVSRDLEDADIKSTAVWRLA
jgi:predicted nicotinamide N-methyase